MAIINLNLQPTGSQLKWFGLMVLVFFLILGGILRYLDPAGGISIVLWSVGVIIALVYYLITPLRLLIYKLWMYVFFPIGWVISNLIFVIVYFVVLTPIGLIMKILRRDVLQERRTADVASNWKQHTNVDDIKRYFRQF